MSRIIGIDLGTTNSCVAVLDDKGQPRAIPHPSGERTMPSCVSWPAGGAVLVGERARRQGITNAAATVFGAKRLIGRKVNADEVAELARGAPFRIVAAPNGDAWVRIHDEPVSPQEIAAHLLRALRQLAEEALGEPVTRAVLTVPAYAGDAQRQAMRDAGQIAGLDVIRILNEPTAAALAYGAHRAGDGRRLIAVVDLGGGTFDISIMSVERGIFEVLATGGDGALGGDDWDRRLAGQIADEVRAQHGVDVTAIPMASARLRDAAEVTKKALSAEREATVTLPFLAHGPGGQPIHYERAVTRAEVEELTRDLIERLEPPCRRALDDAGLAPDRLDDVLLVGGMTRWPAVQAMVQRIFGKRPAKGANPDEVVALGAAAYGGILAGLADDAQLLDVTPHDIGIKVSDDQLAVVVPRNSMLPVRARRTFATTADDQRFVTIELYQGGSGDLALAKSRRLGQVVLDDLPPGPAGSVRVELVIDVNVESILSVSAKELQSGRETAATIRPSGGLSQGEIVEIIARRRREQEAGAEGAGAVRTTTRDHVVSRPGEDEEDQ